MADKHRALCPVMADEKCITVGGTSKWHDRGKAGDCRCGVKCQCALIDRAVSGEREALRRRVTALMDTTSAEADREGREGQYVMRTIGHIRAQGMKEVLDVIGDGS
jgi:hypothetical protein